MFRGHLIGLGLQSLRVSHEDETTTHGMADVEPVVEPEPQMWSDEGTDLDLVHEDRDLRQVIAMMAKGQRCQACEITRA